MIQYNEIGKANLNALKRILNWRTFFMKAFIRIKQEVKCLCIKAIATTPSVVIIVNQCKFVVLI